MIISCKTHGRVRGFQRKGFKKSVRCCKCVDASVKRHRRKVKKILVEEAGGRCVECGYNKSIAALEFHHLDPTQKEIRISSGAALDSLRKEVIKCILLCANCHREAHYGEID